MKNVIALLLISTLCVCQSFAKCKGFEDFKPSYCVKITVKSTLEDYEDGCIFRYDLMAAKAAMPLQREYPFWKKAFSSEGDEHYMKIGKSKCEQLRKTNETVLKGILSQLCYDTVSYEYELWSWLKSKFGFRSIKPRFEFSEKASVLFHDKGKIEVSCPIDF